MRFQSLPFEGAWLIIPERERDLRGAHEIIANAREFADHGIDAHFALALMSYTVKAGTVRGMHFQKAPQAQAKLVRCIHGTIQDLVLDLREDSPTYLHHAAIRLDSWTNCAVFIPEGFAHGFQSLTEHARVEYQLTREFVPELAAGVRWDDEAFGITLPMPVTCINYRDSSYPDYRP